MSFSFAEAEAARITAKRMRKVGTRGNLNEEQFAAITRPLNYAKLASAVASLSNVGMASTRRVTVSAYRTRHLPQSRRRLPPLRESVMELRTRDDMPELSICWTSLRLTRILFQPCSAR